MKMIIHLSMIENQATINDLTLRLDKERAKLDVDQAAKSRNRK